MLLHQRLIQLAYKEVPLSLAIALVRHRQPRKSKLPGLDVALITHQLVPYLPPSVFHGIFKGAVSLHAWAACLADRGCWGESGTDTRRMQEMWALFGHWIRSRRSLAAAYLRRHFLCREGTGPAGQAHCAPADHTKSRSVENLGPRLWKHQKRGGKMRTCRGDGTARTGERLERLVLVIQFEDTQIHAYPQKLSIFMMAGDRIFISGTEQA